MRIIVAILASFLLTAALCGAQSEPKVSNPVPGTQQQGTQQPESQKDPSAKPELPQATIPQQTPSSPSSAQSPPPTGDQTKNDPIEKSQEEITGTSNDRLFWTLPNFLTVRSTNVPPLTTGQKFKVVARSSFDPIEGVYIAFLSGISQASDSEEGYGQGAAGYGKRFGAAFADNTIENFMTGAVLPSMLKQDPRYYQLGEGSFAHRTGYAISRIFVTRSDDGRRQFNISEIAGAAIAGGISTAYHPVEDRTFANTLSVWWTQIGWDTMTTVVKEFWPDIHRKLTKKSNPH